MYRNQIVLLALIATSATGCAYHKDLKSAAAHAEAGEWRDALEDYEAAQARRPRSDKAAAGIEAVKEHAVEEALVDAAKALDAGKYEKAFEHVAWAEDQMPDVPEIGKAKRLIEKDMRAALSAEVAKGDMEGAYDLAVRTKKLFPKAAGLDAEIASIRDHFVRRSDGHAKHAEWTSALAALDVVYAHEPDQKRALSDRDAKIRYGWADEVLASAKSADKGGDEAAAAALYGRAWEIAGRDADLAAMRREVDGLQARGAWDVAVIAKGGHAASFGDDLESALLRADGVRTTSDKRAADLVIEVDAGDSWCEQHAAVRLADQPYVAGYRDVPNPAYDGIMDELHRERAVLQDLADREELAGSAVEQARRTVEIYTAEVFEPREAELRAALASLATVEQALKDTAAEVARLEEELARLDREGGPLPARAQVTKNLEKARAKLVELRSAFEGKQAKVAAATAARDEAKTGLEARVAELEEARRAHGVAAKALKEQSARVGALEDRRRATPATVKQEIVELFRYEVSDWTRTCTSAVDLTFTGAGGRGSARIAETRATADTAWGHFPQYGVTGDPLRFPLSDAELFARADQGVAPSLQETVRSRIAADRAGAVAQALAAGDAEAALASYLAAPADASAADRGALERLVARSYGLEDLATLLR